MAEIINPFDKPDQQDQFVYLGLPGLIPSALTGWFMSVEESDRNAIIGFAPIFVDKTIVEKYFKFPVQLRIQQNKSNISAQDQIQNIQRQQKILKGENPNDPG
ncbi:MAG: hypothetical protein OH363_04965 [Candidatus Parvarchaeota archaeon]|nr:hypothetical protein [Candidatus Jingweiarchaeum tengchongense]